TAAVVLAIGASRAFAALQIEPDWLWSAPTVAAAFGALYALLEHRAWRWRWVRALGIVNTPVVEGVYVGRLQAPPWRPGVPATDRPATVSIQQTWKTISITFAIDQPASSTSRSMTAELLRLGRDTAQLTYTYTNNVTPGVADPDMHDHDGTARLVILETGAATGRYYNFRGRQGSLTLQR
ncbi:MAG: hypothetical protein Q7T55_21245, partial [Solirubrobacteraceae bacterium]|nr:hypothetical protein [Solirubrobacteraceae bacterium]